MKGIGGNLKATFQVASVTKNEMGERVQAWEDVQTIQGWLDLASGNSNYTAYYTKIQERKLFSMMGLHFQQESLIMEQF